MVEMQAMMMPFCSTEMIVTLEIRVVISVDRVAIAESSRLAEASEVSLNNLLTNWLELSVKLEQSASNLSAQTRVREEEASRESRPEATLSIPAQLARVVASCWSAAATFSSSVRSSLIWVTTSPALLTREAVASFTAPAAVPVKAVRAAARREGD